ncbi:serine protease inhibitor A3N-like [Grammomys surdaster]|uniref:serine protease inhibitor A3N-like n=1 Tax=Grammomys surdaster TaxID=491861 RepID=UPI0010A05FA4|nr:serine protease inhibitor A3N-like [Grammomys surdaster]
MAFTAALWILMAGICPAVLCFPNDTLELDTALHVQENGRQVVSLTLASSNTGFAFSLYKELALQNPDKNVVFSPLSISGVLAIVSLGAKGNTMEEILEGLKFSLTEILEADIHRGFGHLLQRLSQSGDQEQISIGSAMFIQNLLQILEEFQEKIRVLYQAEAFTVDFQQPHEAKNFINGYVSNQTQGKIKELMSDLDEDSHRVAMSLAP